MDYFPLFLDARKLNVLIVGAGEVAARKLELIMKTPATVTVIAPWVCDTVKLIAQNEKVTLIEREFEDNDLIEDYKDYLEQIIIKKAKVGLNKNE